MCPPRKPASSNCITSSARHYSNWKKSDENFQIFFFPVSVSKQAMQRTQPMKQSQNPQNHPDDATLSSYLAAPDAPRSHAVALHLAGCANCRRQVSMMQRLQTSGGYLVDETLDAEQQQMVDDFVYARANQRSNEARDQIRQNPAMLKSALYSLAHGGDMAAAEIAPETTKSHGFGALLQWLQELRTGWISIPATALATALLTVLVLQIMPANTDEAKIIAYQDDPAIHFFPASDMPGIGFFSAARQRSEDYPSIHIEQPEAGKLRLNWPPIEQAQNYRLTLHGFRQGKKILLKNVDSNTTSALITLDDASPGQRFVWTLSGKTAANERFFTSGGFVLRNSHEDE
jgi:hypothetical protein